ncbi:unnamed protein product [Cylicocyclus nassatus]|uniref:Uncharacterized protein n=1 Tax=Cylicocyclus nassatus TaxID=53992 RepID=A0AA36DKF9_CYLNA|nr:unnamed protein product [Cylicocyclus nassatus]
MYVTYLALVLLEILVCVMDCTDDHLQWRNPSGLFRWECDHANFASLKYPLYLGTGRARWFGFLETKSR